MDYVAIAKWVEDVIMSCKTPEQAKSAEKLFKLYKQQTNKESYTHIHRFLNHCLNEKINRISYGSNGG